MRRTPKEEPFLADPVTSGQESSCGEASPEVIQVRWAPFAAVRERSSCLRVPGDVPVWLGSSDHALDGARHDARKGSPESDSDDDNLEDCEEAAGLVRPLSTAYGG